MAAQEVVAQPANWSFSLWSGLQGYQGDLGEALMPVPAQSGLLLGAGLSRRLSPALQLQGRLQYSELAAEDGAALAQRGFRFSGRYARAHLSMAWSPWGKRRYPGPRAFKRSLTPYVLAGGGLLRSVVRPDFSGNQIERLSAYIDQDKARGATAWQLEIAVGGGMLYDLGLRSAIFVEAVTQTAFSDHLDGVSHSGNPAHADWMPQVSLGLTYRLLPPDRDRDGIADEEDACPQVPGPWSARGCPDADEDGIEDLEDLCRDEPGPRSLNGCPDTDGDGVADREDRCPASPGLKATLGCPDADRDGLADLDDRCPFLPGKPWEEGCPPLDADADGQLADEHQICLPAAVQQQLSARLHSVGLLVSLSGHWQLPIDTTVAAPLHR